MSAPRNQAPTPAIRYLDTNGDDWQLDHPQFCPSSLNARELDIALALLEFAADRLRAHKHNPLASMAALAPQPSS